MRLGILNRKFFVVACIAGLSVAFVACKKDNRNDNDNGNDNGNNNNSNTWAQKANYPGAAVAEAMAVSINGKIYVGMGCNKIGCKSDLWEYDPATNKWTEKSDFPWGQISGHIAHFVIGDKLYIVTASVWEYNATTNQWTQKTDYPIESDGRYMPASFSYNNKGYLLLKDCGLEYNPATDTWLQFSTERTLYSYAATASSEQMVYTIEYKSYFWTYNLATNKWYQKPNFPIENLSTATAVAFCKDGVFYAGLGCAGDGGYLVNKIYKYNNEDNSWNLATTVPDAIRRASGIAVMCNGKLYVGLGFSGGAGIAGSVYSVDFWEYTF